MEPGSRLAPVSSPLDLQRLSRAVGRRFDVAVENIKVWHEGDPTDGIGCFANAAPNGLTSYQKRANVDKCVWWGKTAGGGGASAPYGKHITAVGQFSGEERGACGDSCPGPNPWNSFEMPPMAYYFWANGHVGFHETTCIDCS
jgi:hypothetical protein